MLWHENNSENLNSPKVLYRVSRQVEYKLEWLLIVVYSHEVIALMLSLACLVTPHVCWPAHVCAFTAQNVQLLEKINYKCH